MKKSTLITILLVAAAGFFLWALLGSRNRPAAVNNVQSEKGTTPALAYEAQTNSEGGVEVELQPLDLSSDEWSFALGMNTHTGSIDADPLKAVVLTDDQGHTFPPIRWDGPAAGGHHRNGTLVFQAIAVRPRTITVKIFDIGGVAKRTFTWQLKPKN